MITIKTKRYFTCPNGCDHEFVCEHLMDRDYPSIGPWFCDVCHAGWNITTTKDGGIQVERSKRTYRPLLVTLSTRLEGGKVLTLYVKSGTRDGTIDHEAKAYFYEEHTCPENYFRDVESIELDGDEDPHGLFTYVTAEFVK